MPSEPWAGSNIIQGTAEPGSAQSVERGIMRVTYQTHQVQHAWRMRKILESCLIHLLSLASVVTLSPLNSISHHNMKGAHVLLALFFFFLFSSWFL